MIKPLAYLFPQKHEKEQEKKLDSCTVAEKNLQKDINGRHGIELKHFQSQYKKQYKENIEKWKKELSQDPNTPKKQREAQLQYVFIFAIGHLFRGCKQEPELFTVCCFLLYLAWYM